MKPVRVAVMLLVLLALGGAGWFFLVHRRAGSGASATMSLRIRGKYAGTMVVPATLNWCPVTRVGVLEGVSGDSGVAIALYEREALTAGPHALSLVASGGTPPTPGASLVMRWMRLAPDTSVAGFRAESGMVRLQLAAGLASGDINARLRSVAGPDSLTVQGTFAGVPVVTTAKGCT